MAKFTLISNCPTCKKRFNRRIWSPTRASRHRTNCALEDRRRGRNKRVTIVSRNVRRESGRRANQGTRKYDSFFANGQIPDVVRLHSGAQLHHYVITYDKNMAPCVPCRGGPLSLALCKLAIRDKAQVGDWVSAALPKGDYYRVGLVRYLFQVTQKMTVLEFHGRFAGGGRRDQIYDVRGGNLVHNGRVMYHNAGSSARKKEDQKDDKKGHVLVSHHFCAVDDVDPIAHPLPAFCEPEKHGRGHRSVPLSISEQRQLCDFVASRQSSTVPQ